MNLAIKGEYKYIKFMADAMEEEGYLWSILNKNGYVNEPPGDNKKVYLCVSGEFISLTSNLIHEEDYRIIRIYGWTNVAGVLDELGVHTPIEGARQPLPDPLDDSVDTTLYGKILPNPRNMRKVFDKINEIIKYLDNG